MLESIPTTTANKTRTGHNKIQSPAKGTQTVSKNGPSLPIRSRINWCHPLKSNIGALYKVIIEITGTLTAIPRVAAKMHPGNCKTLQEEQKRS